MSERKSCIVEKPPPPDGWFPRKTMDSKEWNDLALVEKEAYLEGFAPKEVRMVDYHGTIHFFTK